MKTPLIRLLFLITVFMFVNFKVFAGDDWSTVKSWRSFGERWALAYDEKGVLTSIYDLAYPDWSKKILFGRIGNKKINEKQLFGEVDEAGKKYNLGNEDLKGVRSELQEQSVLSEEFSSLSSASTLKELQRRETNPEVIKAFLKVNDSLDSFFYADFLLKNIQVVPKGDGSFDLIWLGDLSEANKLSGPKKICDLRSLKWAFVQTAKIFAISTALSELTGISGPTIIGAVVSTALDRFFHFYGVMLKTHQNMLLEALFAMENPNSIYAQTLFDAQDRKLAIESLVFSQASLEMSWRWKWTEPEKELEKMSRETFEHQKENNNWLSENKFKVTEITPRFGFIENSGSIKKVVNLASRGPNEEGPITMVDYQNPKKARNKRIEREIEVSAVVFGTKFIPYGGFLASYFFKKYVEGPIDAEKVWEGRLLVELEEFSARLLKDFSLEFNILQNQRINPLMASRDETAKLISYRRNLIGVKP